MSNTTHNKDNELFPVFLKLENLRTLVIGGGKVGLEKVNALISNSPHAKIRLIAPEIRQEIVELSYKHKDLKISYDAYHEKELEAADVVVVATNDRTISEQVYADARKRKVLINVADTPDLCDFYLGSVVKKGDLKIAISTNGQSPTLAKRLREYFERYIPDEIQDVMVNLNKIRERIKGDFAQKVKVLNQLTAIFQQDENDVIKN